MTAQAASAGAPLARRARAPRLLRRRVTLAYELALAAAWLVLVVHLLASPAAEHGAGAHGMTAPHHLGMWALMCVATMLPATLPALAHVAVNSLRRRRRRAMATFAAVYLGVWIAFGGLVLALAPLWSAPPAGVPLAAALALAAGWQFTVGKRRALRDCHRSVPLPPRGWRATAAAARFGLRNGGACVGSCWALMLAMAAAGGAAMLPATVAMTAVVTTEKLAWRPRRATRLAGALLAAAALVAAAAAAL